MILLLNALLAFVVAALCGRVLGAMDRAAARRAAQARPGVASSNG